MVFAEFASIDGTGKLIIQDGTSTCEQATARASPASLRYSERKSQMESKDTSTLLGSTKPSVPLSTWLDYYEARGPAHAELQKLEARRSEASLIGGLPRESDGSLDNALHWLERTSGAIALLQEMREEHLATTQEGCVLPVGRLRLSPLLTEWAGSEAIDILAEALPQLVDQVDLYEETLGVRTRRNQEEQALRKEVDSLREEVKAEKRQKEYYYQRFREMQQAARAGQLGMATADHGESDNDSLCNVPIYTEADMKAMKQSMLAQIEALERHWQERLEEERRRAREREEKLRDEIRTLREQLEAALQRAEASAMEGKGDSADSSSAATPRSTDEPFGGKESGKGSSRLGASSPYGGEAAGRIRPQSALRTSSSDGFGQATIKFPDPDAVAIHHPDPTFEAIGRSKQRRPSTAPAALSQEDVHERRLSAARRWEGGPSEDELRRQAEDLKRRVFESVLAEERKRQDEYDEQEERAIAARWELQGQAELSQLLRRIDDQAIRRDLFRVLKGYCKRSPAAMEVVCVYCRRKPRPDQIYSFDTCSRSRPSSASRAGTGTTISKVSVTDLSQALAPLGSSVPRVSSCPSVGLCSQNGARVMGNLSGAKTEPRRSRPQSAIRPPKLLAAMPSTHGSTLPDVRIGGLMPESSMPRPQAHSRTVPTSWSTLDPAC